MKRLIRSKSLRFFLGYQKKYVKTIIGASLILLVSVVLKLPTPLITKHLIDNVIPSRDFSALNNLCLLLLGLIILHNLSQFCLNIILAKYSAKIRYAIESDFYAHVQKLPMKYFFNNSGGYILSRINEIANTERVMASTIVQIARDSITLVVGAIYILKLNPEIGLVSLAVLPVFIYSIKAFHKKIKSLNIALHEERANYMGKLERNISAIERIKVSVKEEVEFKRIARRIKDVLKIKVDSEIISSLASVTSSFVGMISPFFVLWYGVSEIMKGDLLLGEFFAINSFLAFIYGPAQNLTSIGYVISQALAGLDRVHDIFQEKPDHSGELPAGSLDSVKVSSLSYRYGEGAEEVLKDVNLDLKAGDKVALIGKSGSGKSTFIKILMKLLDGYEGEIKINGVDLKDFSNHSYRSRIGYLGQNQQLLEEDISDLLAEEKSGSEVLKEAGELCSIDLEKIGEKVIQKKVSGGEAQRLDAMELISNLDKDILIVDEGTSHIDAVTENRILDHLFSQYKDKIILYITHDLKFLKGFDRFVFLEGGSIASEGTHDELITGNSDYKELWENNIKGRNAV